MAQPPFSLPLPAPARDAALVVGGAAIFSIFWRLCLRAAKSHESSPAFASGVRGVVANAHRYAEAAPQDGNEALALTHAAYAAAYFDAARALVGDPALARMTRTDVALFAEELARVRADAAGRVAAARPGVSVAGVESVPAVFHI